MPLDLPINPPTKPLVEKREKLEKGSPWMMASRMTMTKKKKVRSKRMRNISYGSPSGELISSPTANIS